MNYMRFPLAPITVLLASLLLLRAEFAISADSDAPDCYTPCAAQYRTCYGNAKDSPNDIEKNLCESERKECVLKCDAETLAFQKAQAERELKENEEKALRGETDDLTPNEKYDKEEQEKQDRLDALAREQKEQQEKAAQEKREKETINGDIKIIQFGK